MPILEARLFDREMVGVPLLGEMAAEVYGDLDATDDPVPRRPDPGAQARRRRTCSRCACRSSTATTWTSTDAATSCSSASGSYKRNLILPQTLKRLVVKEANFAGDHLEITFGRPPSTDDLA